jgi:hypothetical protein
VVAIGTILPTAPRVLRSSLLGRAFVLRSQFGVKNIEIPRSMGVGGVETCIDRPRPAVRSETLEVGVGPHSRPNMQGEGSRTASKGTTAKAQQKAPSH